MIMRVLKIQRDSIGLYVEHNAKKWYQPREEGKLLQGKLWWLEENDNLNIVGSDGFLGMWLVVESKGIHEEWHTE